MPWSHVEAAFEDAVEGSFGLVAGPFADLCHGPVFLAQPLCRLCHAQLLQQRGRRGSCHLAKYASEIGARHMADTGQAGQVPVFARLGQHGVQGCL